jgi:NitT/TauT family transport system permease protein
MSRAPLLAPPGVPLVHRPSFVTTARWGIVLGAIALLELCARTGLVDPLIMPAPSAMLLRLVEVVRGDEFVGDLATTVAAVLAAFGIGATGGLLIGILFWRLPFVGATFEPYLVSLYSMPTLVFYPILLAVLGLGPAPIIAIATTMALIPVALNTMVGLNTISPTLPKLARSLNCSRRQLYLKVLAPAATPLVVPGLVLGFIYAMIGVIAMEFILASAGLGFRIGYTYRAFDMQDMYAYILVVLVIAVAANVALNGIERRVRKDMG